jgi:hypothetical protein
MAVILLCVLLSILGIFYAFFRRATRTSVAQIPGPEPESFLLGIITSLFHPLIVGSDTVCTGNLRELFQGQAAEVNIRCSMVSLDI